MELIINLYQEEADRAIDEMLKAWEQYEATKNSYWLQLFREHEAKAIHYITLAEQEREFI